MSRISRTGEGLNVLISCESIQCHDWMTFAAWYSLSKNMPDAIVKIVCHRVLGQEVFSWPHKVKAILRTHQSDTSPRETANRLGLFKAEEDVFVIDPMVMAVVPFERELDFSELEIADSKEEKTSPFVSYFNGCCKFVLSEWINRKSGNPFLISDKLQTIDLTVNERRIIDMWGQCRRTYMVIS